MVLKVLGTPVKLNIPLLLGIALGFIICYLTTCRCIKFKEGFAPINENMEKEETTEWISWAGKMHNGGGASNPHVSADPEKQLEEGNLFMFNGTNFSHECCPSPYGSSKGCACMSDSQYKFLNQRGGNRTQSSIY